MAKPRKMLGNIQDPEIQTLMRVIPTQSRETLASWAAAQVRERYLPLVADCTAMTDALDAVSSYLRGQLRGGSSLSALRPTLSQARLAAQNDTDPVRQAALRAISTACSVLLTPSNALGFTFYGAAARAYAEAGCTAPAETLDGLARRELSSLLASLQAVCVPDEPNPVVIDWNC